MRLRLALPFVLSGLALAAGAAADPAVLTYPKRPDSPRWNYALGLIELALKESGRDTQLKPTSEEMSQTRAARELELGHIDFIWTGTSADYEQRFRAVRIPVMRGLDGYRICVINPDRQAAFSAVRSLDDLRKLTIGQDPGWSDVKVLDAAGFKLETAPYDSLFEMVDRGRFDCFLRGAHEAPTEVMKHPGLAVENDLLIVYPFTSFFFVNKENAALAEDLENGLKKAYEDGSFMAYFKNHPAIKAIFEQTHIEQRRRFDIPNPLLTDATRAIPPEYWQGP
ncbi:substrate-binding periplasmic protein [Dongia sp.]|uniref:substrate-binding periplasmic protein n=1 Tax=Dongia sp. TaxID=1977262 RepID=UPI003751DF37